MEANTLRGLDAKWEAAHEALAAAVHALEPERVHAAATEWVDCAIRFGNAVPMDGTTNSGDEGPSDTNMGRVWGRMAALSQLGARLGEATQQPGREECATECVARFCRAVWPRILDEQAYPSWEDNGEYGDVFCNVPLVGSAKATLRLVLTRYDKFGAHMTILIVRTECTNAERRGWAAVLGLRGSGSILEACTQGRRRARQRKRRREARTHLRRS